MYLLKMFKLFYPHMLIGKVWIYRLLFVCVCVCAVANFSADDKASGVNFSRRFIGVQGRE